MQERFVRRGEACRYLGESPESWKRREGKARPEVRCPFYLDSLSFELEKIRETFPNSELLRLRIFSSSLSFLAGELGAVLLAPVERVEG